MDTDTLRLYPADAEERLGFDRLRARLDGHARTPYGRERLAALKPSTDRALIESRLTAAGEMKSVLAFDAPFPLGVADDLRPLLKRLAPKGASADPEALAAVARVLATLRALHGYLKSRAAKYPALWAVGERIVVMKALEDHLNKVVDEQGRVRDDASAELSRLSQQLAERQGRLRGTLQQALRDAVAQGWATEEQPTIRGGRAVIPVRAEAKRKVPGFVHDVSSTGQTVYIEPASVLDLGNEIRELEAERRREIERILREAAGHVRHHVLDIEVGLDALARLDTLSAIGRLANELGALVPALNDYGVVRLVRARNPVLALHFLSEAERRRMEDGARGDETEARSVVPLDLTLGDDAVTLVITGPNAGGKSVALKSAGVLCLMAQCGIPVPADPGTALPVFTRLFVDLGDQQSIQDDLSTFTSHLQNIQQMLEDADDRSLALIDEAGTGTDPAEGGALAEAILRRLTKRGVRTIATTHHGTLKAFAHNTDGAENGSMLFDRATLAPSYRFRAGVPGSSYAFDIAQRVGLDRPVVEEARRLVGEGKAALEDLIGEMERQTAKAAATLEAATAREAEAERIKADYDQRLERLRADRDRLRAEALAQAEGIVKDANATVENTIRAIKESEAEKEATKEARERLEAFKTTVKRRQQKTQQRQRRRQPARSGRPDTPVADGPIAPGDQVQIDGGTVGEVIEVSGGEAVVALGAMTTRAKIDRLQKVGGPRPQRVVVKAPSTEAAMPAVQAKTRVDVRGQRVEEAVPAVMRLVDEAASAGLPSVEILHGKGTGALRQAIREHLAERGDVASFESAAWNAGGDGVTVAVLG